MDLKKFRHDYHISQKELAEVFGCGQGHISNIESGMRSVTALQVRLLIERFGLEAIAKYADKSELPASGPVVSIDMSKGHTEISGNQGPVNNGSGNQTTSDPSLIDVMNKQADHITKLIEQQNTLIQQQAQLIALLQAKQN